MSGLGIIGTAAALLNYNNAKKEYDALKEQQDGLLAAVQTYNDTKYDDYASKLDTKPSNLPDGVVITTLLRVANLVGKIFRTQASVVLTNTSNKTYYIDKIAADCFVFDMPIYVYKMKWDGLLNPYNIDRIQQEIVVDKEIASGETLEIALPKGISGLTEDGMVKLRETICAANEKKLITSCKKTNVEGIEKADIRIIWSDGTGSMDGRMMGKSGILRYCGEAGI